MKLLCARPSWAKVSEGHVACCTKQEARRKFLRVAEGGGHLSSARLHEASLILRSVVVAFLLKKNPPSSRP